MYKQSRSSNQGGSGLHAAVNAQLDRLEVEEEISAFVNAFTIHQLRPAEAKQKSRSNPDKPTPTDLLDQEIYDLRRRMIDVTIIDHEVLEGREHRRLQPFLGIEKTNQELVVRATPFSGTDSVQHELQKDISFMHQIDAFQFVPVDSLRDLYYQNKHHLFKGLIDKHQIAFDVPKNEFRQWAETTNTDPACARLCQQFNHDVELALGKRQQN